MRMVETNYRIKLSKSTSNDYFLHCYSIFFTQSDHKLEILPTCQKLLLILVTQMINFILIIVFIPFWKRAATVCFTPFGLLCIPSSPIRGSPDSGSSCPRFVVWPSSWFSPLNRRRLSVTYKFERQRLKLDFFAIVYLVSADLVDAWRSNLLEPCRRGRRILPAARARLEARRFKGCSVKKKVLNRYFKRSKENKALL